MTRLGMALAAAPLAASLGCGYHVSGHADLLPKSIRIIAVPAFGNATTRYKLADRLSSAVGREFLTRTRYRVVADPNLADAVLQGALVNYTSYPAVFDPATGRASGVLMVATLEIKLLNRVTGETIFVRPSMEVRERYEIAIDPRAYFEESDTAVERMSREVARSIVSAVLEKF
jgi:RNase P/RNase MRP subunit p29